MDPQSGDPVEDTPGWPQSIHPILHAVSIISEIGKDYNEIDETSDDDCILSCDKIIETLRLMLMTMKERGGVSKTTAYSTWATLVAWGKSALSEADDEDTMDFDATPKPHDNTPRTGIYDAFDGPEDRLVKVIESKMEEVKSRSEVWMSE